MRQLLRAVHRDLLRPVRERRVAEAGDERLAVRGEIGVGWHDERRCHLVLHQATHERDEVRLRGHLIDVFVAREKAEIRERRMAGVQQAQLHRLERLDIVDELRPAHFPLRPRRRERHARSPIARTARTPPAPRREVRARRRCPQCPPSSWPARCDRPSSTGTPRCRRSTAPAKDRAQSRTPARCPATPCRYAAGCRSRRSSAVPRPFARRSASARVSSPTTLIGASGVARSRTTSGCSKFSVPLAGSWQ